MTTNLIIRRKVLTMEETNIFNIAGQNYVEIARVTLNEKVYVYLNNIDDENEFIMKEYNKELNELKDVLEREQLALLKAFEAELSKEE